ncbi:MAG: hypothetical protein Q8S26_03120 [Azonexus sp.]|nr:hypothetical protein [Azonexus sp.]
MNKYHNPAGAKVSQATHAAIFGHGHHAATADNAATTLWSYPRDERSCQLPLVVAGEVDCDDMSIPVWRVNAGNDDTEDFQCKFVRYIDMPVEMALAFREHQVLVGKPFAGAAYVEDFELFVDLMHC